MIYYLLHEKEREEMEQLLIRELVEMEELIYIRESVGEVNIIKDRAIKEKRDLLLSLMKKISKKNK